MKKKSLAIVLALVLALTCVVGGSLAWLKLETSQVQNTFTFGNIGLDLSETPNQKYVVIPGQPITKDPKVTVTTPDGFEPVESYVFVKIDEVNWSQKLQYKPAQGWMPVPSTENVYYQVVTPTVEGKVLPVLEGNHVTVDSTLTKAEVEDLQNKGKTQLNFTAYAIQKAGFNDVNAAWNEVSTKA